MKFVALALALLLAVGSQAASVPADASSVLGPVRAAVDGYLLQLKESAKRVLSKLENTEYQEVGVALSENLDVFHNQFKEWQAGASPVTDSVVAAVLETTADFRRAVREDFEKLKMETEEQRQNLRAVFRKHIEEYQQLLQPIIHEYHNKHIKEMEDLRVKLEPLMESLRSKIDANVQETTQALMPIVDNVKTKLRALVERVKEFAAPYVAEYAEQVKTAINQPQQLTSDDLRLMKESISPLVTDIQDKFVAIFTIIGSTLMKN